MNITSDVVSKSIRLFSYISLAIFVKFHYGTCIYVNRFHPHKKSFNFETHIVLLVLL